MRPAFQRGWNNFPKLFIGIIVNDEDCGVVYELTLLTTHRKAHICFEIYDIAFEIY